MQSMKRGTLYSVFFHIHHILIYGNCKIMTFEVLLSGIYKIIQSGYMRCMMIKEEI